MEYPITHCSESERGDVWVWCVCLCVCVCSLSRQDIGADICEINTSISLCLTLYIQRPSLPWPPPPCLGRRRKEARERKGAIGSVNDNWPLGLDWELSSDESLDRDQWVVYHFYSYSPTSSTVSWSFSFIQWTLVPSDTTAIYRSIPLFLPYVYWLLLD